MVDTEPMVQAALSVLGLPYVWGGTSPVTGLDCSGLTQWAAGEAGIKLSRTTYTQILEGDPVTGAPQRGDLVFPDAGHVGIALGGNQMVHAPETGDVVKISDYWTEPIAIRRLGTNSGTVGATTTDPQYRSGPGTPSLKDFIPTPDNIRKQLNAVEDAVEGQIGFLNNIGGTFKAFGMFLTLLMSGEGWTRILKVAGGTTLMLIGIAFVAIEFVGRML